MIFFVRFHIVCDRYIYIRLCSFHHLTIYTFTQLWDSNDHTSWDCVILVGNAWILRDCSPQPPHPQSYYWWCTLKPHPHFPLLPACHFNSDVLVSHATYCIIWWKLHNNHMTKDLWCQLLWWAVYLLLAIMIVSDIRLQETSLSWVRFHPWACFKQCLRFGRENIWRRL